MKTVSIITAMGKRDFDEEFTPLSPWLDLVNSEQWDGFGRLTDHLLEPGWVTGFLRHWKFDPQGRARTTANAELAELRSLIRKSSEKIASGKSLSRRDLHAFNTFLNAPSYPQLVTRREQIRTELTPVRRNWSWVRSRIAASFVDSFLDQSNRIKVCGNPQCRWAFLDTTKSNIRRWCHDRRCGNRDRVRRARARARP